MDKAEQGADEVDQRYIVPGLERGLHILQLFNATGESMTLAELAEGIGLSRSSAYRLVYTLEKSGFLSRDAQSKRYALTSRVMTLGYAFLAARPLVETVQPFLQRISQRTRLAAHLVELDGTETVYLARVAPSARVISNLQVGMRLPAHRTVSGRVLLSGLTADGLAALYPRMVSDHPDYPPPELQDLVARANADRERGFVMGESAFDPGIESYATPVKTGAGQITAALNVIGPKKVLDDLGGKEALDEIVGSEARQLSRALGWG
ncbi:IclR family transcriptional regulator [Psychromarinibacter halotolerans]|uniref:IclR family transcriptional regulator n=1 Tax=Psychromarinibacter halotolerans TaxID=1775175 RepID=A0ABV7GQS7_9RHOB|nr:IclR family transcriptional regulator [Psychromarinibacter halotolerans]MDF0596609.1 IclR family transcriptional regulator [Psychromarinibacter halotolerans]